ncbi:MAG: hypothetical protein U0359_33255 [Byssovorax sp.]
MKSAEEPSKPPPKKRRWLRRLGWALGILLTLEFLAGRFVARPLKLIVRSPDPVLVYQNNPGIYLGHATYDVWSAPLYVVLDLMRTEADAVPAKPPPGYVLYRIDDDGCRAPTEGPLSHQADILFLGSSQAFGMLVSAEDSVPGVLERSLHEKGYPGIKVANCAVIGHRFVQTLMTTERAQKIKQPKLVVTIVRPWHMTEQFDYTDVLAPRNDTLRWLVDRSSLARLAHYANRVNSRPMRRLSKEAIEAGLDAYKKQMDASGTRTVFFLLDDLDPDCSVFDDLMPLLQQRGLGAIRLQIPSGPKDIFIDRDHHWSIKGSAMTADQLLDPVIKELEALGVPRK